MSYDNRESSRYSGQPVKLYLIQGAANVPGEEGVGPFAFSNGEKEITRDGITYKPWPIKNGDISTDGTLDKSDITVSLSLGTELDSVFLAYPPSQVVNLTIFEGHLGDDVTPENFPAIWIGRIVGAPYKGNELELSCVPVSTSIKRPGLRRNYQIGCPHVLYGPQCRANKAAATITRVVQSIVRNRITLTTEIGDITTFSRYAGGLVEWSTGDAVLGTVGRTEYRTIAALDADRKTLIVRGSTRGLNPGASVSVVRGCNHQMDGCNQHSNIHNYGGQPFIPLENPLSQKSQFY